MPPRSLPAMRSTQTLLVGALTLAGAALRLATIDVQGFWFDEALTSHLLELSLGDMLAELPDTQLTPPLYYVLAWPWVQVFGGHELALRSFSALAGVATIPVAYLAGRELVSRRAGVVLAALTAFNPLLVWYSQEGRPYALLALLGAASLLFFARALRRRTSRELWLWAAVAVLALLTHYFAAFLVVPQGLWLAWVWQPRSRAIAAGAVVAAVGAALIPLAHHQTEHVPTQYIQSLSLGRRLLSVPEDFVTGFVIKWGTAREHVLAAVALAVALVASAAALLRTEPEERHGAWLVAGLVLAAAGVPSALAVVGVDYLSSRNVLVATVPALLLLAAGLGALRAAGVVGTALLCAVGVVVTVAIASDREYHRSNFRTPAEALGQARDPRALVVPPFLSPLILDVYLDGLRPLPPRGAEVVEVDVLTPRNSRVGGARAARPERPLPPGPSFRLVERRYAEDHTLIRWRAPRPVLVTPAAAARAGTGVIDAPNALVQDPGR